jgi:hypothetical protein
MKSVVTDIPQSKSESGRLELPPRYIARLGITAVIGCALFLPFTFGRTQANNMTRDELALPTLNADLTRSSLFGFAPESPSHFKKRSYSLRISIDPSMPVQTSVYQDGVYAGRPSGNCFVTFYRYAARHDSDPSRT